MYRYVGVVLLLCLLLFTKLCFANIKNEWIHLCADSKGEIRNTCESLKDFALKVAEGEVHHWGDVFDVLKRMEIISLRGKNISIIEPITYFKKVKILDLENNRITNIDDIFKMNRVEILFVGGNKIKSIMPLYSLKKLSRLDIDKKQLVTIKELLLIPEIQNNLTEFTNTSGVRVKMLIDQKLFFLSFENEEAVIEGNISELLDKPQRIIKKFHYMKYFEYGLKDKDKDCSICLEKFLSLDDIIKIEDDKCKHIFHKDCILHWISKRSNCPNCRLDLSN